MSRPTSPHSTIQIRCDHILTPAGSRPGTLTIAGPTIASVELDRPPTADTAAVIDADGWCVAPGLIDLQINGGFGVDLLTDPHGLWTLGRQLPRHGVTGFLPTIISGPPDRPSVAVAALADRPDGYPGAEPLGLHLEGPMLSAARPGAHPVEHLRPPSREMIEGWSRSSGVALVTLAPELPGGLEVVAELVRRGVVVSAGHTDATASDAAAAIEAGVSMVTHLFNAMAPLGHREPNLVGVALADRRLVTGLIADGVHVDPLVVAAVWRAKGPEGMVLVTDAVAPMGGPPGRYRFAGRSVTADDRAVRTDDGRLAGSVLTMDRAVRNVVAATGCRPDEALVAATATPAAVLGDARRGRLVPGARADVVVLDEALEVQLTLVAGRVAYAADSARSRLPARRADGAEGASWRS